MPSGLTSTVNMEGSAILNTNAIAGIVIGCIVAAAIIGGTAFFFGHKRAQQRQASAESALESIVQPGVRRNESTVNSEQLPIATAETEEVRQRSCGLSTSTHEASATSEQPLASSHLEPPVYELDANSRVSSS